MTTSTAAGTETKHALWFKPADPLIRALANGLLFASTDRTLSMLNGLRFEFDGNQLEVLATDRWRASIEIVQLDPAVNHAGQAPFQFLLQRDAVSSALKMLKAAKRDPITLTFDSSTGAVRFEALEASAEYRVYDAQFPPLRSLYPDPKNAVRVDRIAFNPQFLADLGKVQVDGKSAVTIRTFGETKPTLIEFADDGPLLMLCPVRLPG